MQIPKTKRTISVSLAKKIKKIKLFLMDVDGTLTDGRVIVLENFDRRSFFSVRDGYGIRMLQENGIDTGIITASEGNYIKQRAEQLKIKHLSEGSLHKLDAYESIKKKCACQDNEIAFIGDDYPDVAIFQKVGFAIGVGDGIPNAIKNADYITEAKGGHGAVREAIEIIAKIQNLDMSPHT